MKFVTKLLVFSAVIGSLVIAWLPTINIAESKNSSDCLVDHTVLEDIRKREEVLRQKEQSLTSREDEIKKRELVIDEQFKKLEEKRNEVLSLEVIKDKKQEEVVAKLVETFEKMSPKSAATLLGKVDEALAVEAIGKISTVKLAKIMNIMPPEKSSRLAELLALGQDRAVSSVSNQSKKGGENDDNSNTAN